MAYTRSAVIALIFTLSLILPVAAQVTRPPVAAELTPFVAITRPVTEPVRCNGSRCSTNICRLQGLSCCQCKATVISSPDEVCACCPSGYFCCGGNSASVQPTCCPVGSTCDKVIGGCTRVIPSIPSTAVCSACDRMYLSITADDVINDLFLDGDTYTDSLIGPNTWPNVRTIEIPADTKVIATNCSDKYKVIAGVLASTTHDYFRSSAAWKCTTQSSPNWMQTTFNDDSWPNAVVDDLNDGTNIRGQLSPISSTAAWIWTANYAGPIDTPVYCRGYFPTASCDLVYGNCSNLCARRKETCCGCEMNSAGPTMVCNCCPKGYKCCGKTGKPRCCPVFSSCQDNELCLEVTPQVPAQFSCSSCNATTTVG